MLDYTVSRVLIEGNDLLAAWSAINVKFYHNHNHKSGIPILGTTAVTPLSAV